MSGGLAAAAQSHRTPAELEQDSFQDDLANLFDSEASDSDLDETPYVSYARLTIIHWSAAGRHLSYSDQPSNCTNQDLRRRFCFRTFPGWKPVTKAKKNMAMSLKKPWQKQRKTGTTTWKLKRQQAVACILPAELATWNAPGKLTGCGERAFQCCEQVCRG